MRAEADTKPLAKKGKIHLCIGAPRSGTTWLFNNLRHIDGVFTPCIKEVRYWNMRRSDVDRDFAARFNSKDLDDHHDPEAQREWLEKWLKINKLDPANREEYIDLMRQPEAVAVDITPAYSFMPSDSVKALAKELREDSKVIYLIRDPLERTLSQLKLHFHLHGRFRGLADLRTYDKVLSRPDQLRRNAYFKNIKTWTEAFGERFKFFYYEELKADPQAFLRSIIDFLEIDCDDEKLRAHAHQYFGTDRNQETPSLLPSLKGDVRKLVAQKTFLRARAFANAYPEYGEEWFARIAHLAKEELPPSRSAGLDGDVIKLMRMTESLGDNCEYGFWQRKYGYEPHSLFRWAITPLDSLLDFLREPRPLYEKGDIEPHSLAMVTDKGFGFKFHSKLVERDENGDLRLLGDKAQREEILAQERDKVNHFKAKFLADLEQKPALYVIKRNGGLKEEKVRELANALNRYNVKHKLLWVRHDKPLEIDRMADNLYLAGIEQFASYTQAHEIHIQGWTRIMRQMAVDKDIKAMIDRMIR